MNNHFRIFTGRGAALLGILVGAVSACTTNEPSDETSATGGSGSQAPVCPMGWTVCGGACVDTDSDGAHCGACEEACPSGQVCGVGSCSATCPGGTTQCGQSCVDVAANADHCGACDQACGPGFTCASSSCEVIPTGGGGSASGGGNGVGGSGLPTGGGGSGGMGVGGTGSGGVTSGAGGELPFLIGADITQTMQDEYWNATYTDGGVQKPLEVILEDHGFNAARIDTFFDPSAPGGYAEEEPVPFRNLSQTITLAKRVKAQGMFFLLDLHMSDYWTNPGMQGTPNAWVEHDLGELEDAVYAYVFDAVTQLIEEGARPDMVQIGNEITNGMLWEVGRVTGDDFGDFAALLKSGIAAVRAVDEDILVMLHIEKCNNLETTRWWLDGVLEEGVEFDVFGQSCYAAADHHAGYQGPSSTWGPLFNTLASEYPDLKFVIAEYSAEPRAANDAVFNIPNERGLGTFNWAPTRFYETHPNVPLFNMSWPNFTAIADRMAVYDDMAADYAAAGR